MHVLGMSPWRRALLLLLRRPVVFLGVAVATAVLAVAASAGVLFASTLGTASLQAQAGDDCPEASMPRVGGAMFGQSLRPGQLAKINADGVTALRQAGVPGQAYWVDLTGAQVQATQVTLFARPDALSHVQLLTPNTGQRGAWFPDDFAAKVNARAGGNVAATAGTIHVAGIYRNLSPDPFHLTALPRYWCTWSAMIVANLTRGPPALLIADPGTVQTVAAAQGGNDWSGFDSVPSGIVATRWYAPIPLAGMNLGAVRSAARSGDSAFGRLARLAPPTKIATPASVLKSLIYGSNPTPPAEPLTDKLDRAQQVQDGLRGSVIPISIAGAVVALLLVAEAGGSWAAQRAREVRLLTSRGVGPGAIGVKALLETLPAAVAGLGVGYAISYLLMRTLGPTPIFGAGAAARALGYATVAVLAGLGLVAIVGAASAGEQRTVGEPRRHWRLLRHLPYELVLVGAGVWAWLAIGSGSGIALAQGIVDIHPLLLIFPLLGLSGVVLLLGRGTALAVPRLGRLARRLPVSGYLALRRIGGSRAISVGLLLGTALPCGLLAYAGTVGTGVRHELVGKYQTNLGAPHVLALIGVHDATPDLAGHGTTVVQYQHGATLQGGAPVAVMGIDPATFDRFAYLDGEQRSQLDKLTAGSGGTALLVHAPPGLDPAQVHLGQTTLPVRVAARLDVFPGLRNGVQPMLVVNRNALAHVDPNLDRGNEAWTTDAQVAALSTAIQHDGYSVLSQLDPKIRISNSGLLPISWIFGYLRALAILIGTVAIAGLVFALSARTRRRTVSYVMSRRMGLRQATHVRSLLVELLAIVGLGWLAGTAAGLAGYAVLTGSLDLQPQLPPGAQFVLPVLSLAATAATVAAVIAFAAGGTHAAAERAHPADILRLE